VPAKDTKYSLADLLRVMQRLRDPESGCPWDTQQDFASIVPSTLEEAYELVAAIEHEDYEHVAEELGDLLFQVVFYAQLGSEQSRFDFAQIVDTLVEKLLRRHPHVFANGSIEGLVSEASNVQSVKQSWEAIKQLERRDRAQERVLDDIPLALPALSRAQKVQKRVASVGFDWPEISGVIAKVEEELAEFESAAGEGRKRQEEEVGDFLFACVNLVRHAGFDAEAALRRGTQKFEGRFEELEQRVIDAGKTVDALTLEELDYVWDEVKRDA